MKCGKNDYFYILDYNIYEEVVNKPIKIAQLNEKNIKNAKFRKSLDLDYVLLYILFSIFLTNF